MLGVATKAGELTWAREAGGGPRDSDDAKGLGPVSPPSHTTLMPLARGSSVEPAMSRMEETKEGAAIGPGSRHACIHLPTTHRTNATYTHNMALCTCMSVTPHPPPVSLIFHLGGKNYLIVSKLHYVRLFARRGGIFTAVGPIDGYPHDTVFGFVWVWPCAFFTSVGSTYCPCRECLSGGKWGGPGSCHGRRYLASWRVRWREIIL